MSWTDFYAAEIGASAALSGLVFVGVSINLGQIIASTLLANRALQSITLLIGVLVFASLLLTPGLSAGAQGVAVLAIALGLLAVLNGVELHSWRHVDPRWRRHLAVHSAEIELPVALWAVAGLLLIGGSPSGPDWVVPATIVSFLVGLAEAWILLIEIKR